MIRLRVLGESVVEVGGHRVGPEASTLFALLLYLSFERGTRVTRQTLIDHLWPEAPDERARHCLRQTLYRLRQLGARIEASASDVELPAGEVEGDFLELAAGARLDATRLRPGGSSFGEFLPGYAPRFSPRFAEWLERQRGEVDAIVRRALSAALLDGRKRHRWAEVEAVARHYLRLDPLNEEATLALAEATALTGSKAKALTMLDRYLTELGPGAGDIRLPAAVLRRRIAERVPERRYSASSDGCFVGREESMELLAGLLREARGGRGQACLIWGDAGIGKTRLAAECAKAAALGGAQVLRVGCQASDARRPLSVFVEAVPALLNLRGALGCSPISMQYLRRLTEHDPTARGPSDAALEAEFLFANVRRSIFDLVDAVAAETTLVVVVEDVHWIDRTSWEVLRAMIDWVATRRVLFLFTSRTEHATGEPEAAPALRLVRHRLDALDDGSAGLLLDALCEGAERHLGEELRSWYVRVAEGNPLFLRELAKQVTWAGNRASVPPSLAQLVDSRLAQLAADSLRLLESCAVLGKNASFSRLETLLEFPNEQLLRCVRELEAWHLIEATPVGFEVRHELIANATLAQMPIAVKQLIHRHVAKILEQEIRESRSTALLWECAEHFESSGDPRPVAALIQLCAGHLIELGLPAQAADVYRYGMKYCEGLDAKLAAARREADALRLAGHWRSYSAVLESVCELRLTLQPLASSHNEEELAKLEGESRGPHSLTHLLLQALSCVDDARAALAHRIGAASLALRLADQSGDDISASRVYRVVKLIETQFGYHSIDSAMCELVYHSSYGDLTIAEHAAAQLIQCEANDGTPLGLARALRFAQVPLLRSGNPERAYESVLGALTLAEQHRLPNATLSALDDLATLCLEADDLGRAEHWYGRAMSLPHPQEDDYLSSSLAHLGTRLAIVKGEKRQAQSLLSTPLSVLLRDQFARRKLANLASWLRVNGASADAQQSSLVFDHACRLFTQLRSRGGQDYNAVSLALFLCESARKEKAYSLLNEYAKTHRREQGVLPKYLGLALQACGAASEN